MKEILIATTNPGKLKEIAGILTGVPIKLLTLNDLEPIVEPEETGTTFAENARLKARYYSSATGLVSIADDSGIEIDALDKAPGVHSARWHGTDYPAKFRKIQELLRERDVSGSTARFVCCVALAEGERWPALGVGPQRKVRKEAGRRYYASVVISHCRSFLNALPRWLTDALRSRSSSASVQPNGG